MTLLVDGFSRSDTAAGAGLGQVPSGPAWEVVAGSWRVLQGRAHTDTTAAFRPLVVVTAGTGDCDLQATVSPSGGDALYARVASPNQWLCARVRHYQGQNNYYGWGQQYVHYVGATSHTGGLLGGQADPFLSIQPGSGRSPDQPPGFPEQVIITHQHLRDGTDPTHTHTYLKSGSPARQPSRDYSAAFDLYSVVLERNAGGTITTLGAAGVPSVTALRLRAVDGDLAVYANGSATPVIQAIDLTGSTVGRHGLGRAPSEITGAAGLDNFSLDTFGSDLQIWTGTAWAPRPLRRWNGTAWVDTELRRWNGTAWVPA